MGMGTQVWEWDQNSLRMRQCKLRLKLEWDHVSEKLRMRSQ